MSSTLEQTEKNRATFNNPQERWKIRLGPGRGVGARQTDRQVGTQPHRATLSVIRQLREQGQDIPPRARCDEGPANGGLVCDGHPPLARINAPISVGSNAGIAHQATLSRVSAGKISPRPHRHASDEIL
jgi:hypothetical protein